MHANTYTNMHIYKQRKTEKYKIRHTTSGSCGLGKGILVKLGNTTSEYVSSYSNFFFPASGSKPPSTPIAKRVIFFSGPSPCRSTGICKISNLV